MASSRSSLQDKPPTHSHKSNLHNQTLATEVRPHRASTRIIRYINNSVGETPIHTRYSVRRKLGFRAREQWTQTTALLINFRLIKFVVATRCARAQARHNVASCIYSETKYSVTLGDFSDVESSPSREWNILWWDFEVLRFSASFSSYLVLLDLPHPLLRVNCRLNFTILGLIKITHLYQTFSAN